MNKIKLLYVENVIFRKAKKTQQRLTFFMSLENLGYDKHVDILWEGEEGTWQVLPAMFHSGLGKNEEYWSASVTVHLTEMQSLPGNIQFNLRYRVSGQEYLVNNHGFNYTSEADSGIKLANNQTLQNIAFESQIEEGQQEIKVTVAMNQSFNAECVILHWTVDNWQTTQKTLCKFKRNHWDNALHSHARNPNQYGVTLWTGKIKHKELYNLQYVIGCENGSEAFWDNNQSQNYRFLREQLNVLILNLHCYQEENQDEKLTTIAQAIAELDVDVVCLQEVAEYWRDGQGDWESNTAKIINDRLPEAFYLYTDWSHLGFDKYREGVAILSRYPLSHQQSRYVSDSEDIYHIHSRKVISTCVSVPHLGLIRVFSAHLSWLEDGFQAQFQRLHDWSNSMVSEEIKATLLCGDFNITAGSEGYKLIVDSGHYEDQFLAVNKQGVFNKVFKVNDAHWQGLLADDYRIDYIFMGKGSTLRATAANILFTEQDYGRVSDHCGYLMTFEAV